MGKQEIEEVVVNCGRCGKEHQVEVFDDFTIDLQFCQCGASGYAGKRKTSNFYDMLEGIDLQDAELTEHYHGVDLSKFNPGTTEFTQWKINIAYQTYCGGQYRAIWIWEDKMSDDQVLTTMSDDQVLTTRSDDQVLTTRNISVND